MSIATMDDNKQVEINRKAISRAVEFEHFDRPISGFVALELFFSCFILAFAVIFLFEDLVMGGGGKPGLSELIWAVILMVGFMVLFVGAMETFPVFKVIVLLGFTALWTFLIVLGVHNLGVGIGGMIGAGIIGFAISAFLHFVGFNALSE